MIKYVGFEDLLRYVEAGYQGISIQRMIEDLLGETDPDPEYTVYWPKDSIRVIPGSSYAVASTVHAILRDARTFYMGEPTANVAAELSLVRRDLNSRYWASNEQVNRPTVYVKDRILPWDISTRLPMIHTIEQAEPGVTYRLDVSTLSAN